MFWAIPEVLHRMEDGAQKNKLLSKATVDIGDNLRSTGKFMVSRKMRLVKRRKRDSRKEIKRRGKTTVDACC